MLCPSTPSTPGSAKVVLSRGRGAKTVFNGRRAVIGRRLGGGWAAVTPEGSQSAVKWRNGHWSEEQDDAPVAEQDDAPVAEQDDAPVAFEEAPLGWLPQDLIVRILKALPTPDTCSALQAARALAAYARGHGALCPFTECHLRDGVPAGLGVRPSRQLAFARYLGEARAQLRSLHVEHGTNEVDVVRWLLQECDTSALARAVIDSAKAPFGQMNTALEPTGLIDLTIRAPVLPQNRCGPFTEGVRPTTARTISGALAQHCPALTSLTFMKMAEDLPRLASITSLRRLEAAFLEVDDVNYLVKELPNLTHFIVHAGDRTALAYERLDLESTSLQSIDISASAKALSFERVNCPALREIVCGGNGAYGNGLALLVPNDGGGGFVRWEPDEVLRPGHPYDPGALCLFGTCWNDQEVPSPIEIPSACVVTWKQWGGWCVHATTSTTQGEVAKAYEEGRAAWGY